jgi:hypothetical protein
MHPTTSWCPIPPVSSTSGVLQDGQQQRRARDRGQREQDAEDQHMVQR